MNIMYTGYSVDNVDMTAYRMFEQRLYKMYKEIITEDAARFTFKKNDEIA